MKGFVCFWLGIKEKALILPPICGVPCGLNRESGVNPGQFPLL